VDAKVKGVKDSLDAHFKGFSIKKECIADKEELKNSLKFIRNL
jgi:hypothetical protein